MELVFIILVLLYVLFLLSHPVATIIATIAIGVLCYGLALFIIEGNKSVGKKRDEIRKAEEINAKLREQNKMK